MAAELLSMPAPPQTAQPPQPPQPLLSEQAVFAKHLFIQGYPLWSPDPDLLPPARQRAGLRIGDVGTVDERGEFDVFFNILETSLGSAFSLPNFPSIEDADVHRGGGDILPREVVSSPETPWDVEPFDELTVGGATRKTTQYGATLSGDGAHIILPQGAQLFELGHHDRRLFENHAREHGADWLEHFKDRLGWPRSNSLYLLTGFYKTCSWSIASFSMQTAANTNPVGVHCTLVEVDERLIRDDSVWQPTGRFKRKIGPPPDRQGKDNQTIFIRGITVTPNLSEQGQNEEREPGYLSMLFGPIGFLNSLVRDSTKATVTEPPKENATVQHVPQISQASHPSEIINRYLLTKEPSAKVAVTHDSQWIAMLKLLGKGS
ncbi:hypothetical protein HD554DRAFT_1701964 [Boletus coccyginus]|nr:hypothetical protein HD554DRAFT_1701964 [Boletus coccyginus]